MLRLAGYFALAIFLTWVLSFVPFVGPFFAHSGILGVLVSAFLLSAIIGRLGERAYQRARSAAQIRSLSAVDSPRNHGKLGALYAAQGRTKKAIEHLRLAVKGEPDSAEWCYRLGAALLERGDTAGALAELERCVCLDEEYAYGAAQMRRAEALGRLKRHEDSLAVLATLERNHGPSPESAYRRGLAYRALGDRERARAALLEVSGLARAALRYQRRSAGLWSLRAAWARFF